MTLYQTIQQAYHFNPLNPKLIGYNNFKKAQKKWTLFLKAESIESFLAEQHYDMVHTNDSFLREVCKIYHIDDQEIITLDKAMQEFTHKLDLMKQPYIFADTRFKRQSEPLIALACIEHSRRLRVDKKAVLHSNDNGLSLAIETIKKYMQATQGILPLWGKIVQFKYHVNDTCYIIDTNGIVIETHSDGYQNESMAIMVLR